MAHRLDVSVATVQKSLDSTTDVLFSKVANTRKLEKINDYVFSKGIWGEEGTIWYRIRKDLYGKERPVSGQKGP
ncbi:hypothetical protein CHS0354_002571 [Potamilus streckersoni]|uniref:Uncharacterized protein n=1 Tax=Potamilus streckersoni TaxID=2493646 RepID=A0AAE0RNG9_9BIVA|nr:hypothetical protein CHS0354_002571 [Potamilus streckersoni]